MTAGFEVSAVIPAYNVERYLRRAIDSVLAQKRPVSEIIVVDDGSTDGTAGIARSYPQVRYVHQANQGAAAARNRGVMAARCEWIAFLDADDCWRADHLERVCAVLEKEGLVWACGGYEFEDGSPGAGDEGFGRGRWLQLLRGGQVYEDAFQPLACLAPLNTLGMVVRRDVLIEQGLFDTGLPVAEDLDLWFKIAYRYPRFGFCWPATTVYNGSRADSLTHSFGNTPALLLAVLSRHRELSRKLGPAAESRFRPVAELLARWVFTHGIQQADKESLRRLQAEHSDLVAHPRVLATALRSPALGRWWVRWWKRLGRRLG